MTKKLIAPMLLATVLMTGCLGTANPAGTNTNSTNTSNTGATNPGGTNTGTSANYYAVGRKWVYDIATKAAGQTIKMKQTIECTAISGDTATIKVSMTGGPGGDSSSTTTVKTNSFVSGDGKALPAGTTVTDKGTESVTVGAGTYANAKKFVSSTSDANADTTSDQWVDPEVGLLKMITAIKPKVPAMPSIPGLPTGAGAGLDLSSTMTMELIQFTK